MRFQERGGKDRGRSRIRRIYTKLATIHKFNITQFPFIFDCTYPSAPSVSYPILLNYHLFLRAGCTNYDEVEGKMLTIFVVVFVVIQIRPITTTRSEPLEQLTDHHQQEDHLTLRVSYLKRLELRLNNLILLFESVFEFSSSRTERRVRLDVA